MPRSTALSKAANPLLVAQPHIKNISTWKQRNVEFRDRIAGQIGRHDNISFDFGQNSGLIFSYFVGQRGTVPPLVRLSLVIRFLLFPLKLRDFGSHSCLLLLQFLLFAALFFSVLSLSAAFCSFSFSSFCFLYRLFFSTGFRLLNFFLECNIRLWGRWWRLMARAAAALLREAAGPAWAPAAAALLSG